MSPERVVLTNAELAFLTDAGEESARAVARRRLRLDDVEPTSVRAGAASLVARGLLAIEGDHARAAADVANLTHTLLAAISWWQFAVVSPTSSSSTVLVRSAERGFVFSARFPDSFSVGRMTDAVTTADILERLFKGVAEREDRAVVRLDGDEGGVEQQASLMWDGAAWEWVEDEAHALIDSGGLREVLLTRLVVT